jgi:enoyl-CoA hydratase
MASLGDLVAGVETPIVTADRAGIRFIIFNRPEARNALTRLMRTRFAEMLAEADADPNVEALIVTGNGGCFCAGVDLKDRVPGAPPVEPNPGVALRALGKPVIAAIEGACVTGGLEIALSCDFAIGTTEARFADTHGKVGLFPRWGGGTLLTSAIGIRRARQMILTGEFVDAQLALAWGLVNEIVASDKLIDRALELATAITAQARDMPLCHRLQAEMLRRMDRALAAAAIEREALVAFDRERESATMQGLEI